MNSIKNFNELVQHLSGSTSRKKVAVVWPADHSSPIALAQALENGIIDVVAVGYPQAVEQEPLCRFADRITCVEASDPDDAARRAVALAREGKVDIIMKGLINTDNLLHAVLNKENGILPRGRVLTHITAGEIPGYDRLLFFSDVAVIPYPTQEQRIEQVRYMVATCHNFGIDCPKIALIHCTEKPNEKFFPFTLGYSDIIEMGKQGEFGPCIIDGPLDLKTACDKHALEAKGLKSPLEGESDAVIFPDIEAGNVFYKAVTLFAKAEVAAILQGTTVPVVLPSRGDSPQSKFFSLALAAMCAK
ncbi:MAG: phosphate butyryltransferase [Muribaculaceae bacterium]|nr:phosphate butyryltransferase [Muribaculaceae bacterium]